MNDGTNGNNGGGNVSAEALQAAAGTAGGQDPNSDLGNGGNPFGTGSNPEGGEGSDGTIMVMMRQVLVMMVPLCEGPNKVSLFDTGKGGLGLEVTGWGRKKDLEALMDEATQVLEGKRDKIPEFKYDGKRSTRLSKFGFSECGDGTADVSFTVMGSYDDVQAVLCEMKDLVDNLPYEDDLDNSEPDDSQG